MGRPDERPADLPEPGGRARASSGVAARRAARRRSARRARTARGSRVTGFAREGDALACDGVSLEEAARRARHAALRLQPRGDRGAYRALRPGLRAACRTAICYAVKANGSGRPPAAARRAGRGRRHRLRRRAAARRCGPGSRPSGSCSRAWGRPTPRSRSASSTASASSTPRARTRSPGSPRPRPRAGQRARVSLRVNPDIDARSHPYISTGLRENKFGVDIDGGAARSCAGPAACPGSRSVGVQCHIGSQITEIGAARRGGARRWSGCTPGAAGRGLRAAHDRHRRRPRRRLRRQRRAGPADALAAAVLPRARGAAAHAAARAGPLAGGRARARC